MKTLSRDTVRRILPQLFLQLKAIPDRDFKNASASCDWGVQCFKSNKKKTKKKAIHVGVARPFSALQERWERLPPASAGEEPDLPMALQPIKAATYRWHAPYSTAALELLHSWQHEPEATPKPASHCQITHLYNFCPRCSRKAVRYKDLRKSL